MQSFGVLIYEYTSIGSGVDTDATERVKDVEIGKEGNPLPIRPNQIFEIVDFATEPARFHWRKQTCFGGLYQKVVAEAAA